MWLSAIKLAVSAGSHVYKKKQEQNEDLAELRAETSLEKQQMAIDSKRFDFGRNFKKN